MNAAACEHPKNLAVHSIDAKKLGNEREHIGGGHLTAGGRIVEGNCQRHGAGSHIGERVHRHIVLRRNVGAAVDDRPGGVKDKVACHEHAALGSRIPHDGGLAGGVAGAVHDTGGQNLHRAVRMNPGVVGDLGDGVKLHHGKGDGEGGDAALGVGHQIIRGVGADEDARRGLLAAVDAAAGDQRRLLSDGHPGVPGGHGQCDGNKCVENLVLRIDGNIHIGAGMDVTARGEIAVDGDIGIAEFQGNGVKVFAGEIADHVRAGDESLVENELCVQVDNLVCDNILLFCNNNVDIPACLVEPQLDFQIGVGVQIVFHYFGFQGSQGLVLAIGGEDDVLCADGTEYINLLAEDQKVQSLGVQTIDAQVAADGLAQVIGENDVGKEDAVCGCDDAQFVQVKVDNFIGDFLGFQIAFLLLGHELPDLLGGLDQIVREGLIEQRVGEGFDVLEQYLKALYKIQMQCIVSQVTQNGDLCQGIDGDFRSVNGNTLVFFNILIELAGQVQAVVAGLVIDRDVGAAPCSEGGGGVYRDQVVTHAALEGNAAGGKGLAVHLVGDKVDCRFQEVLGEGEVASAADGQSVLAVAAVHGDIGRAHVHREAELTDRNAFRVGLEEGHDHVAGVDELDAAHVLARAQLHVHAHCGGCALRAGDTLRENISQTIQEGLNVFGCGFGAEERGNPAEGIELLLCYIHSRRYVGSSSYFQGDHVVAVAAVHLDVDGIAIGAARDVGDAEVDGVILPCAVVLHAARVFDADQIPGGQVQAREDRVESFDVDVDAALQLYIAFGLGVDFRDRSLRILHDGVMGNHAKGQLAALGGILLQVQNLLDQIGKQTAAALIVQIQSAQILAVLHHDGSNVTLAGRIVFDLAPSTFSNRVTRTFAGSVRSAAPIELTTGTPASAALRISSALQSTLSIASTTRSKTSSRQSTSAG